MARLERQYRDANSRDNPTPAASQPPRPVSDDEVRRILAALDERGAWVERGELKSYGHRGDIIDSRTFIRNVDRLSRYLGAAK
jgi:hypothetical protein